MNIAIVSIQNITKDMNGVCQHAIDLKNELCDMGENVVFITPYTNPLFNRLLSRIKPNNILLRLYLYMGAIAFQLWFNNKNVDIINAQDIFAARATRWLPWRGRKRNRILTCHFAELPWVEFVNGGLIERKSIFYGLLKRKIYHWLQDDRLAFAVVSKQNHRMLNKIRKEKPENCRVIYNGISTVHVGEKSLQSKNYIVNVGRINELKNQIFLVKVAIHLQRQGLEIPIYLVGPYSPDGNEKFKSLIEINKLGNTIKILGPVSRNKVYELLQNAWLYFHTAKKESFGMAMVEAMSNGVPALALDNGALKEILPPQRPGFLDRETTPENAAKILINLKSDQKKLNEIRTLQYNHFNSYLTVEKMASSYQDYYYFLTNRL